MFYSIYQIQSKIANIPAFKDHKVAIIQFFNINNLVQNLGINTVYTSDNHPPFFFSEKELFQIFQVAEEQFSLKFHIADFYEGNRALFTLDSNATVLPHNVKTIEDIERVSEQHSMTSSYGIKEQEKDIVRQEQKDKKVAVLEAEAQARKDLERQNFDKASNLLRDFIGEKVVSIDFEFFINKNDFYHITELGITFNENGKNQSFHFLVEEHCSKKRNQALQQKFDFGKTEIIKEKQLKQLIEMSLTDAKYLLFHEQREDYEILNQLGVKVPNETLVIDTQLSYKRYFRQKGSLPNGEKLEGLLSMFNIPYKNLHNAGNDAYMTLVLLQKMSAIQQHLSLKNKPTSNGNKALKIR